MACRDVLALIDDMVDAIRETLQPGERGFIACERDGNLSIGARCKGDGYHCSVESPSPCPDGSKPAFSFHTHTTRVPLVEALIGDELEFAMAEELVLLPSAKDIKTDKDLGVPIGCIGGTVKDGAQITCFQWKDVSQETIVQVSEVQNRAKGMGMEATPRILDALLDSYYDVTGKPCLEVRLSNEELEAKPWRGPKHTRKPTVVSSTSYRCPSCRSA